jgi:hypothetical protein
MSNCLYQRRSVFTNFLCLQDGLRSSHLTLRRRQLRQPVRLRLPPGIVLVIIQRVWLKRLHLRSDAVPSELQILSYMILWFYLDPRGQLRASLRRKAG